MASFVPSLGANNISVHLFSICLLLSCFAPGLEAQSAFSSSSFDALFEQCPNQTKLHPCDCNPVSREIVCGRGIDEPNTVRYIFQDASRTVSRPDGAAISTPYRYSHLIFENSPLNKLVTKSFDPFTFIAITVRHHYYLTTFEPEAFWPASDNCTTLKFDFNPKLGYINESVHSLFGAIRSFPALEMLIIHNCGLTFIPAGAFGEWAPHLRRISLMNNAIKSINGGAISHLPKLRWLSLAGNKLDHIEPNAIELTAQGCSSQHTYEKILYFIDLSNNHLAPNSLNATSIQVDCSAELNLSNNSLTYLPQAAFRPLFAHSIKILLMGNPLDCANCHMAWLLKGRFCASHNSTLRYHSLLESTCDSSTLSSFMQNCAEIVARMQASTSVADQDQLLESDGGLLQCPLQGPNSATRSKLTWLSLLLVLLFGALL